MDRDKLKQMLPHGALKKVAKRAGVSSSSVSNFFNGRNGSYRIEMAAMEVAKEYELKRRELSDELLK